MYLRFNLRWLLSESIIGVNPGVGLRPKQTDKLIDSSIFIFDQSDVETAPTDDDGEGNLNADAVKRMENFMAKNSNTTNLVVSRFLARIIRKRNIYICLFHISD